MTFFRLYDIVLLSLNCFYHFDANKAAHFLPMKETPIRCDKTQAGTAMSHLTSHTPTEAAPPSISPHPPSAICPCAMSIMETLTQQSLLGNTTLWSVYSSVAHKLFQTITLKLLFLTVFAALVSLFIIPLHGKQE